MKPNINKYGYYKLGLYKNKKRKDFTVHRLVMLTFVGPSNLQVNHKNGIKTDNRLSNLEYVSQTENIRHSYDNKLHDLFGENNSQAKLTEGQVLEIRNLIKEGLTSKEIAQKYLVSRGAIDGIKTGRTWKHLK